MYQPIKLTDKFESWTNITVNVFTISSIISMIFGGLVTVTYLESIKQTAIFPDILTSPSALLALIAVFLILSSSIMWSLITPYLFSKYMTNDIPFTGMNIKNQSGTTHYVNIIISSAIFIFIWLANIVESIISYGTSWLVLMCFLFYIRSKLKIKLKINSYLQLLMDLLLYLFLFFVIFWFFVSGSDFIYTLNLPTFLQYLPTYLMFFVLFRGIYISSRIMLSHSIDKLDCFLMLLSLPLSFLFSTLWLIMMTFQIANRGYQNTDVWWIFGGLCVIWFFIYLLNGYIAFDMHEKNQKINNKIIYFIFPMILFFLLVYIFIYLDKSRQLQRFILKPLHFIEYPSDSNWYTIDTRFFAPNNLSEAEIKKNSDELKKFFKLPEKTQCTYLPEILEDNEDNQKKPNKAECLQLEKQFQNENKYNRFYGYVAWNLGEMKVFCPYGYEKTQENKDKSKKIKCLALKSEYIIPYY